MLHSIRACVWAVLAQRRCCCAPLALRGAKPPRKGMLRRAQKQATRPRSSSSRRKCVRCWRRGATSATAATKHKGKPAARLAGRGADRRRHRRRPSCPASPTKACWSTRFATATCIKCPPSRRLPEEEIATLVEWVRLGAPWGIETAGRAEPGERAGSEFDLAARAEPLEFSADCRSSAAGGGQASEWIKTPVDRFILAGWKRPDLSPARRPTSGRSCAA